MKKWILIFTVLGIAKNLPALSNESKILLSKMRGKWQKEEVNIPGSSNSSPTGGNISVLEPPAPLGTLNYPGSIPQIFSGEQKSFTSEPKPDLSGKSAPQHYLPSLQEVQKEGSQNGEWKVVLEDEVNFLSQKYNNGQFYRAKMALQKKNYEQAREELRKTKKMLKSGAILIDPEKGIWSAADDLEVGIYW